MKIGADNDADPGWTFDAAVPWAWRQRRLSECQTGRHGVVAE